MGLVLTGLIMKARLPSLTETTGMEAKGEICRNIFTSKKFALVYDY